MRQIERALLEQGVFAWFDEQAVLAGDRFPVSIEKAIDTARVVVVFLGPNGMGCWQDMEYQAALQRSVEHSDAKGSATVRLIPVLLPGLEREPELPVFLRNLHHVDLRDGGSDNREGMRRLVDAILAEPGAFGARRR